MNNVFYFIPARGGSKGVVDKNLKKVGVVSITRSAVLFLADLGFDEVTILSSDSKEILAEGRGSRVVCDERPAELASDKSTTVKVIEEYFQSSRSIFEIDDNDWIITVEPTSPFRRSETLLKILDIIKTGEFDTVLTMTSDDRVSWCCNNEVWSLDKSLPFAPRRQDRDFRNIEANSFFASQFRNIKNGSIYGDRVKCIEIDKLEATDINDETDLLIAQAIGNRVIVKSGV